ncbi:hypothetical protein DFQ30_002180 [Apophysomyces sp. BC1015]|nr:hypothetical protein DFQ30_002180 [Apophysomyces sp. BC1015]
MDHSRETANLASGTSGAFRKFCRQILHATQLSESVVLLSLKYIAMLLQNNPNIQGAEGSEYRLFTVALMLANKFLDDNTFTNKTWSDVSGMKVTDLNIMEFEFLDVLRFRMFVRKDEYERWKTALVTFRSQVQGSAQAEEHQQRQKVLEATLESIGLSMLQQQDQQQWSQQQEAARQHQQQQQVAAQQYHQQYLYLLSKAQQPQFPTQPLNRPLVRVPLRIPVHPTYRPNIQAAATTPQASTPMYESRPAAAAPTGQHAIHYPASNTGKRTPAMQQAILTPTSVEYVSQYPPKTQQLHPPPSNGIASTPQTRPVYDEYAVPSQPMADQSTMYQSSQQHPQSNYGAVQPQVYVPHPSYAHPQSQHQQVSSAPHASHRAGSLPPTSNMELATPTQEYQTTSHTTMQAPTQSLYYYATPSSTPTPGHAMNDHNPYMNNGGTPQYTSHQPRHARTYYMDSKPTNAVDYNYNVKPNEAYGQRPQASAPLAARNTPYQNTYPHSNAPPPPPPQGYGRRKPSQPPQYEGPVPEDPMTAADSYRTNRH